MASHSTTRLDLTGCRFGLLTATHPAENIGTRTAWYCRCDCGTEVVVKTKYLRAGKARSCGCQPGDSRQPRPGEEPPAPKRDWGHPEGLNSLHYIDGTCVEMLRKNPVRSNNSSGVTGVEWRKNKRRWRVNICFKGHRYYLGYYADFEDAVRARKEAEAQTHGAFLAYYDSLTQAQNSNAVSDS